MKKKIMMLVLAATMMLSSSITVLAAPEVVEVNGDCIVFDYEYYVNTYPDVVAAVGTSKEALIQHYISYGSAEGRSSCAAGTDVYALIAAYKETNPVTAAQVKGKKLLREDYNEIIYFDAGYNHENKGSIYYEYDAKGNLISEIRAQAPLDGVEIEPWKSAEYSYDNNGNVVKKIMLEYDGSVEGETTYEYDAQRNLIKEDYRYNSGEFGISIYNYDGQNNIINEIFVSNGYYGCYIDTYLYDSNGVCTQKIRVFTDEDGNSIGASPTYFTYTYDINGNLIKELEEDSEIPGYFVITEYTYDSYGNVLTMYSNDCDIYVNTVQYIYE